MKCPKIISPYPIFGKKQNKSSKSALPYAGALIEIPSADIIQSFSEKPGKLFLLYGDNSIFKLSLRMAALSLAKGNLIAVVDGCNQFDVYTFSLFARRLKIDPNVFLRRIFVSRGFTCYQIEQAIIHKLPRFLTKTNSKIALIFGLLDTFYDEQVPLQEVQKILHRLLLHFNKLKSEGISLLITCSEKNIAQQQRNQLFTTLKNAMDKVYKLNANEEGKLKLSIESYKLNKSVSWLSN